MIDSITIYAFLLSSEISAYTNNDTYLCISTYFYFSIVSI